MAEFQSSLHEDVSRAPVFATTHGTVVLAAGKPALAFMPNILQLSYIRMATSLQVFL